MRRATEMYVTIVHTDTGDLEGDGSSRKLPSLKAVRNRDIDRKSLAML